MRGLFNVKAWAAGLPVLLFSAAVSAGREPLWPDGAPLSQGSDPAKDISYITFHV